jgi:hypothetical protein
MTIQPGDDATAFVEVWHEFTIACAQTVAPEATYQAWLAHFAINRFGLLRVVREVDFGSRHLGPEAGLSFTGHNLMVDVVILREPTVNLPRRVALDDRSGLARLHTFSVITELKVASTQIEGMDYGEVARDFKKLSAILDAAQDRYPDSPIPAAFVGVFANHQRARFNFDLLRDKVTKLRVRSDVQLLMFDSTGRFEPTEVTS